MLALALRCSEDGHQGRFSCRIGALNFQVLLGKECFIFSRILKPKYILPYVKMNQITALAMSELRKNNLDYISVIIFQLNINIHKNIGQASLNPNQTV